MEIGIGVDRRKETDLYELWNDVAGSRKGKHK